MLPKVHAGKHCWEESPPSCTSSMHAGFPPTVHFPFMYWKNSYQSWRWIETWELQCQSERGKNDLLRGTSATKNAILHKDNTNLYHCYMAIGLIT